MLHEIFSSVFQTGSSAFELGPFLACTAVSLLLGLLIAWTHAHGSACSRSFLLTLVMLPAVVQTVIMLVNGSIGTGIAVAGAFSLIRFRSVPGGAREIGSIFLAMAIGLATGLFGRCSFICGSDVPGQPAAIRLRLWKERQGRAHTAHDHSRGPGL